MIIVAALILDSHLTKDHFHIYKLEINMRLYNIFVPFAMHFSNEQPVNYVKQQNSKPQQDKNQ